MGRQKAIIAVIVWGVIICTPVLYAMEEESLFSENAATHFIRHASDIHQEDPLDAMRTEQAMTFLTAAAALDIAPDEIPEEILQIGADSTWQGKDYSRNLLWAIDQYLDEGSDLEVVSVPLRSMLERLNSRIDREVFLDKFFRTYANTNKAFASEVATQLGLLAVEKSDMQTALAYFSNAYILNPYNQLAFSKLWELSQAQGIESSDSVLIAQNRTVLEMNPYNLEAAVEYADSLRQRQIYGIASKAYEYASKVHQFLYPEQALPDEIIEGWLFCCYHGERLQTKCLGLTETYRDPARFNLLLEAIAGKTLIKLGRVNEGRELLKSAALKAEQLVKAAVSAEPVYPEYLGWFYSFVLEQPEKALAWSNQAFVSDPDREGVEALFAYSLAMNGQYELAQQYADPLKEDDQIAAVTSALVLLSKDQKQSALDALRAAVEMSPDSFVAEKALRMLEEQDSDYIAADSLGTVQTDLETKFGGRVVPEFAKPAERCSVKLLFNGSDFLYGADFPARLVIENTSNEVLVISNEGFLQGHLRVDAAVKGSLNVEIPNLLSIRFRPSQVVLPGKYLTVPLNLNRGRLGRILKTYPQADVQVHFTAYLDPMPSDTGHPKSRLKSIEPVRSDIRRRGVILSQNFLLQRLDVLSKGQRGQKYRAASMFAGLLAEQNAVRMSGGDYQHVRVEQALLTDSVRKMLVDNDWKIRAHVLSDLLSLSVPLDGIVREVSDNLNHEKWPVRMAAMALLAKLQPETFQKVLDWAAEHDSHVLNRRMAVALGGRPPQPAAEELPEMTD